jgi:hypothetical protein
MNKLQKIINTNTRSLLESYEEGKRKQEEYEKMEKKQQKNLSIIRLLVYFQVYCLRLKDCNQNGIFM